MTWCICLEQTAVLYAIEAQVLELYDNYHHPK